MWRATLVLILLAGTCGLAQVSEVPSWAGPRGAAQAKPPGCRTAFAMLWRAWDPPHREAWNQMAGAQREF